ncbi:MAG: ATP-binding cassette domain-containing protein [Thermodesulfovibrionales bacterium]|nr:ATP-binding cassette domain-containing protein [Thermodesulfovibrionales bacterium]
MVVVFGKGLVKDYSNFRAVDNINFEINKGECYGFLGPNGAGKTTVMRMIYCFTLPTKGELKVFGMDVYKDARLIKAKVGVMPQDDNLDIDLTVIENLIVYGRYFDIPKKVSKTKAIKLLEFVGLVDKADISIQKLSGGMRRRLLLARALINDPELLILDEPTVGLDPHSRHILWDSLKVLKSKGVTIIVTTHYMEEAEEICDYVAFMESGRIIIVDKPLNLTKRFGGNLEKVFMKLTEKH